MILEHLVDDNGLENCAAAHDAYQRTRFVRNYARGLFSRCRMDGPFVVPIILYSNLHQELPSLACYLAFPRYVADWNDIGRCQQ